MIHQIVSFTCSCEFARSRCLAARSVRNRFRGLKPTCWAAMLAGAIVLLLPVLTAAQGNPARARITAQINEGQLTTLSGNQHPLARPQYDQGAVADSQPMRRMLLLLQRSPDQESALRTLIDQQQSKSSANFHQWLTPQQVGQQFGPPDADVQAVTNWLQSHGFQIARVSTSRTLIEFSGTAGQVRNAFHTEIHRYTVNGELHFANATDPQIPTALADVVVGPVSLHNFPRKAQSRKVGVYRKDLTSGRLAPLFSFPNGCPSNSATGTTCNALGPGDFAKIYHVQSLWDSGVDGTGQTIAIVGDSEICTVNSPDFASSCNSNDDVADFRNIFGLPAKSPNVIVDGPDPGFNGDEIEGDLDVQWSGGIAKNATIDFVIAETTETSAGVDLAAEHIVDNNLAPVVSESFGACESSLGTSGNQFYSGLWEQAAAQGMTVIVSAGDNGSAGCDDQNTQFAASGFGPGVNGIASTLFDVAAGGTDFDVTASNYQNAYWGSNTTLPDGIKNVSALSYIPETTWNDSCAQNFTSAVAGCTPPPNVNSLNIVAGSGGQSNCVVLAGTSCSSAYPKPSWQTVASGSGLNASNDLSRDLPDVSLFAAAGAVSNSFYAICDATVSGGPCSATPGSVDVVGVGGTSSAAPSFAGIMALVNQQMTTLNVTNSQIPTRQGNANYVLYSLSASQSGLNCSSSASGGPASGCTFNDVTKGNNSVPCVGRSFGCSDTTNAGAYGVLETVNSSGNPTGTLAFNAGTGFDLSTGLGSINAANLVNNWSGVVGKYTPTTTTLCLWTSGTNCPSPAPTSITITHGQTVNVQITVTPNPFTSNSIPEDASLIGCFSIGACQVSSSNTAGVDRFNFGAGNADIYPLASNGSTPGAFTTFLVGGSYAVIAHYAGDGTHGGSDSTSPVSVTVNPEPSTATVTVSTLNPVTQNLSSNTSVPYGDFNLIRVDVKGATSGQESATGTVTLEDNAAPIVGPTGSTTSTFNLNSEGNLEDQTAFLAVGSHSFMAKYNGDASYSAMTSFTTPVKLTVTQAPTSTTFTFTPVGNQFVLTATVDTQSSANPSGGSSGLSPTGMVTFKSGNTILATAPASASSSTLDANGFDETQWTVTGISVPSPQSVIAIYSGDGNYQGSTSVSQTVGPTFTLSSSNSGTITVNSPGLSGTDNVTATGSAGYSGTITLTVASVSPNNLSDPPNCSFGTTGTITLNSSTTSGSGTLTCTTTPVSSALYMPSNRPHGPNWILTGEVATVIAGLFLLGMAGEKQRGIVLLGAALLAVVLVGSSCGSNGSGGGNNGNPGTTVGNYTVTVNAAPSSGNAQQITVTLTVN